MNKNKRLIASLSTFVAVLAGIFGFVAYSSNSKSQEAKVPVDTNANDSSATVQYKDGTYAATGTYKSPAGPESVEVSIKLEGGVIVDSTVIGTATNQVSKKYQADFIDGYKSYVTGKSIDGIRLDIVSGSSLTPAGFNDALQKIKAEARV